VGGVSWREDRFTTEHRARASQRGRIFTVEAHVRDMKSGEWAYVSHGDANVLVVRLDGHAMSLDGIRFGLDVALASPMFGSRRETEAWAADRPARRETRGP